MVHVIFTLDYEIHGNGEGDPYALMVEPTARMMNQFDKYGAKLTIMADVAEILRFKDYYDTTGRDSFHYCEIASQLQDAIRRGHDVQLHLHPGYFNAKLEGKQWVQDWSEYNFATLPFDRMSLMLREGKNYLENLLRPVKPSYECYAFRAANWAAQPSQNLIRALLANNFRIETSVFKHGIRKGLVEFDYSTAPSSIRQWRASDHEICTENTSNGRLWEYPIYSKLRPIHSFITPMRCYRAILGRLHKVRNPEFTASTRNNNMAFLSSAFTLMCQLTKRHPWKADFNQCTGRQLACALNPILEKDTNSFQNALFLLIGHSKLYTPLNALVLTPLFLRIQESPDSCRFSLFSDNHKPGIA